MHLKEIKRTTCYIDCQSLEEALKVSGALVALGSKNSTIKYKHTYTTIGVYSKKDGGGHQFLMTGMGGKDYPRYSFSDLSDFKESTKTN